MDDHKFNIPTTTLKQKFKSSLCFSCCFPHHHRPPPLPPPSSFDENSDKWRSIFSFLNGNGNRHKRHSSTEFRYDPLSYSLNFEDEAPFTNFSSRLPLSPVTETVTVKNLGIAAPAAL
ncbi:hypothetical protein FXO37_11585 [Capsicum annuum]|nr:hypothetical protein FXO37_11585 [Capsicum annuum]